MRAASTGRAIAVAKKATCSLKYNPWYWLYRIRCSSVRPAYADVWKSGVKCSGKKRCIRAPATLPLRHAREATGVCRDVGGDTGNVVFIRLLRHGLDCGASFPTCTAPFCVGTAIAFHRVVGE